MNATQHAPQIFQRLTPSLTFQLGIANCYPRHSRHEGVFEQWLRLSIGNKTRYFHTLHAFKLFQEDNFFSKTRSETQLLRTLSLQNQTIINHIGTSLTT